MRTETDYSKESTMDTVFSANKEHNFKRAAITSLAVVVVMVFSLTLSVAAQSETPVASPISYTSPISYEIDSVAKASDNLNGPLTVQAAKASDNLNGPLA